MFVDYVKKIKESVLDFIFPPFCVCCHAGGKWLCDACMTSIKPVDEWDCVICEQATSRHAICSACVEKAGMQGILVVGHFDELLQKAVHAFKYKFLEVLAEPLGRLLTERLQHDPQFVDLIEHDDCLLMPVPLHARRLAWRGFNQSELLAREVQKAFPQFVIALGLTRVKETRTQMELARTERLTNMEGAFVYEGESLAGKIVFLVDDVSTTGATLFACVQALRRSNPKAIWGIVLAHG